MLKLLRKKMRLLLWITTILVVPTFVIWGSMVRFGEKRRPTYAGTIFGKKVSFDEYINTFREVDQQNRRMYGDRYSEFAKFLNLEEQTWDRLTLLYEAKRRSIKVSDGELSEEVSKLPAFQKDGKFSQDTYHKILGDRARAFEEELRRSLIISKLSEEAMNGVTVSEEELKDEYKKENEKAKISYALFAFDKFKDEVKVEESELESYYNSHEQALKKPEEVNIEFIPIEFAREELEIVLVEDDIKKYYDSHLEEFALPDPVTLPLQEKKEKAFKQLDEVREDIKNRLAGMRGRKLANEKSKKMYYSLLEDKTFDDVAKEYNLTVGETGFFSKEKPAIPIIGFSYEILKAAFELAPGDFSEPLQSSNGYYIIRLKERKESYIPKFEDVREEIEKKVTEDKAKELARKKVEETLSKIKEAVNTAGKGFEDVAKELKIDIQASEAFTRRGYIPNIGMSEQVAGAAFSLKKDEISNVIEVSQGYLFFRLNELLPPDEEQFKKEMDTFKTRALSQKKSLHYREWFTNLKSQANVKSNTGK